MMLPALSLFLYLFAYIILFRLQAVFTDPSSVILWVFIILVLGDRR